KQAAAVQTRRGTPWRQRTRRLVHARSTHGTTTGRSGPACQLLSTPGPPNHPRRVQTRHSHASRTRRLHPAPTPCAPVGTREGRTPTPRAAGSEDGRLRALPGGGAGREAALATSRHRTSVLVPRVGPRTTVCTVRRIDDAGAPVSVRRPHAPVR